MRPELLDVARCPACAGPLRLEGGLEPWIEAGTLVCDADANRYPIRLGMPYLYVDDESWQPKAREADGWVRMHRDRKIYDQTGVDVDFRLPYFEEEPWIGVARQFDIALELIKPARGLRVLDVGAGRGWAAKQLAVRGCSVVAVDVTDDDQVGLGRSRALMEEANVRFDAVVADSERLPFADASFDVVFCAAALHHTTDFDGLMANISRVLRPGGRLVAVNEPCIADDADDEEVRRTDLAEELSYGINETRPRLDDYRRVLARAGLRETALFAWQSYGMSRAALTAWSRALGVPAPRTFLRFARGAPQAWTDNLLRRRGGEVILAATKDGVGSAL